MLKKVICLLLVLACSVALFGCLGTADADKNTPDGSENEKTENNNPSTEKPGGDTSTGEGDTEIDGKTQAALIREQNFFAAVNNSRPNVIATLTNTTHAKLGTCVGYYRTTIFDENNYSFYYEYEKFNNVGEGAKPKETVGPATIYYKDGKYSLDNESWIYENPDPAVLNVKLDLNKNLLGNYVISDDGTELVTKLTVAQAEKVLGVKIYSTGDIKLTVKTDGTRLWKISVDYKYNQTSLNIETSYTYENVSGDAK